ncbi:MAG TPA: hypothetical protein VD757_00750, partial [Candidatus Nitrosocosmicus sp.]|nr:hypothetical protein [Candidatus Nitrosocosmicus sp.]
MKANIVKGIALLFDALLLYIFIFNEVLRKSYIEVTNESIKQGTPFGTKILGWYEVDDIDIISVNRQKSIALSRMQKPGKRRSFYREMDAALGGSYYINIPVNSLKGIDVDTLFTILRDKLLNAIRETETGRNDVIPPDELGSEEPVNSYSAAIIK